MNDFVVQLQETLKEMGIGILRVEKADLENQQYTLTVAEDLDCSGLSVCDEQICVYDEGFVSGLFKSFTGNEYSVREVDCWCSGDRGVQIRREVKMNIEVRTEQIDKLTESLYNILNGKKRCAIRIARKLSRR